MQKSAVPRTDKQYWDAMHSSRGFYSPKAMDGFRHLCEEQIFLGVQSYFSGGEMLEIGGGSSDWLIAIAKKLLPTAAVSLDYSKLGCANILEKAKQASVSVEAIHADMFDPPEHAVRRFDFVMSFGVVEHFENLPAAISTCARFCKPGGILYTLIPNMSGLNGALTKRWNRAVYDMHIPHDRESFLAGHNISGLEVLSCDYLGSTNFGVLSSCFPKKIGLDYWVYKQLTRFSKAVWLLESKLGHLPATSIFSPYIVSVSRIENK